MKSRRAAAAFVASVLVGLASCDAMQGRHSERNERIDRAYRDAHDPAKTQTVAGVSLTLPKEGGWKILSNESGFFAAGARVGPNHTAGVTVSRQYPLAGEFSGPEQFQKTVEASLRDLMPGEVEVIKISAGPAPDLGTYCVKYMKRARRVEKDRPVPGGLIYQGHGLGCQHPLDSTVFVDVSYSELGPPDRLPETDVESRANQILGNVQWVRPNLRGSESGFVGLELQEVGQYVEVVSAARAFDAARQGIQPGDRIVEVDGASAKGLALPNVVQKLRGASGTKTRIVVSRQGESETRAFTVTRLPARWSAPW